MDVGLDLFSLCSARAFERTAIQLRGVAQKRYTARPHSSVVPAAVSGSGRLDPAHQRILRLLTFGAALFSAAPFMCAILQCMAVRYWLFKSEPDCFSIEDLRKKKRAAWDGVRNFQVRNFLRDDMKKGDWAIFYHSSCKVPGAVGTMEIVKEGYPDHTAWDPTSEHPDARSTKEKPLWYMVDVAHRSTFSTIVPLSLMHEMEVLQGTPLLERGNRLSIVPLSKKQYDAIACAGS